MSTKNGKKPSFWKMVQKMNKEYCEKVIQPEVDNFIRPINSRAVTGCRLVQGKILCF